jgi:hypothetical protein
MSAITVLGLGGTQSGERAEPVGIRDGEPALPLPRATDTNHGVCPACGSMLDAPRLNRTRGEIGRKCADCGRWQPLVPFADY